MQSPIKVCSGCNKALLLCEFHKRKASVDGMQRLCKSCQDAWRKATNGKKPNDYKEM